MKASVAWGLLCIGLAFAQGAGAQAAAVQWSGVERTIVFADVHGAGTELRQLLRESGVVDATEHWAAGKAHLVSLGDLLDRGLESRAVMDLLMRLQGEAAAAGGQVHVLLGNHEAMNLMGDLRYVDAREYASWADLDPPGERDPQHPAGYAGRKAALAPGGKYGQWLLAQPVAIRINDTLFMHAGPGRLLNGISLQELNLRYRTAVVEALQRPAAEAELPLLSEQGPNWYRGTALCNETSESDVLLPLLMQFAVTRVVVGHTPTRNRRVVSRFGGKVILLDTGMNHAAYKGTPAALFMEGQRISVRYAGESGMAEVEPESLFVAPRDLSDAEVMKVLREGEVGMLEPRVPDEFNAVVSLDGRQVPAVFQLRTDAAARRELAALQLDRLLGLGVVPATIEREVQGKHGVLQARPLKWLTQAQVQQQAVRGGGWCNAGAQFQLLYALDTLSGYQARVGATLLWDTEDWIIYSTSFAQAFDNSRGLPAYLRAKPPALGAELRRRLAALDDQALAAALGDLLSPGARRAILARRDALLAVPAANNAAGAAR